MSARRGDGKRKRGTNKETEKKNGNVGNKKWRVTKPQQDKETEEYLKEKRNLEYLWKAAFPVGTDALCGLNWDFKHLEEALEEGGFSPREEVYVLGAALRNKKEEHVEKCEYCLAYFSESEEDDIEESSTEELKDEFKELVEERVRVGKVAHQAARDRRAIERMRRLATRHASENMKLYKFYPQNSSDLATNMMKSPFIRDATGMLIKSFDMD
ncbi:hypothetical protein DY000_02017080 [Brassica cretica]|uniref:DUF629 domain-containing protein n=1 Tax=Brassica cretica TaxID=69181 RepID=A0ABQ7D0I2_BRACR|nr:hypothetical protein DY000_02017080 [Brassica cretica]